MASKNVVITIRTDGEVLIEAFNFAGVGCKKATADLEMVLAGGGSTETKPKPDFFQSVTGANKATN